MSTTDPRTPCIVGVARHTWHRSAEGAADAPEPLTMWEHVVRAAAADARAPALLDAIDSLQLVYCQTWQYDDPVGRLAERLGASPRHRHYSGIGGTTTQQLVAATAESMLRGELDVAVIASAEALATQRAYKRRGERPRYSFRPEVKPPFPWESPMLPTELAHEVFQAWLTFALFDNARRARLGVGLDEYRARIGALFAPMTKVAAASEHAWFPIERGASELVDVSPENRMVGYPYTKYTVSVMDVDMAAALVLTTHERADALGIPAERRVYPRGWAYATDPTYVAEHHDLAASPAMRAAADEALRGAGVGVDDVAHLDLYSCFASSVHFACDALGIDPVGERALTVTGGLPYHGGPGSGYLTHSIAATVEALRADPGSFGLVSGVGMHMTKHAYGAYSTVPGRVAPPDDERIRRATPTGLPPTVVDEHDGPARVAAYSVVHGRDGRPEWALLVCDVAEGVRAYAKVHDAGLLARAEESELVGRTVRLTPGAVTTALGEGRANFATE